MKKGLALIIIACLWFFAGIWGEAYVMDSGVLVQKIAFMDWRWIPMHITFKVVTLVGAMGLLIVGLFLVLDEFDKKPKQSR